MNTENVLPQRHKVTKVHKEMLTCLRQKTTPLRLRDLVVKFYCFVGVSK